MDEPEGAERAAGREENRYVEERWSEHGIQQEKVRKQMRN